MKAMFSDFGLGIRTWGRSWNFILSNGLAHYFLYPVVISVLIGMGAMVFIDQLTEWLMSVIAPHLEFHSVAERSWWEQVKMFSAELATAGIKVMLWVTQFYLYWKFGKYLTLAAMSPVMALLSERTDKILSGKDYPFNGKQFVRDIFRGILMAARNAVLELLTVIALWMAEVLLLWFLSPVGIILTPVFGLMAFFVSAYFYGFSTIDYTSERRRLGIRASVRYTRKVRGLAAGNGTMFSLLMLIPWIGTSLATVTCTVAAGLAIQERDKKRDAESGS
ncbi:MAG: EI24 domain-containing protein [Flavobacteriales bacterium]|nr:EI24 domain-containing protein [Flavobacteriales bacterium]